MNISSGVVHSILHDALQLRKLCAKWIPHLLHPQQKNARVNWCKEMLKKFDHGRSRDVSKIITGDETWIYHYDPQTKQQSRQWCEVGEGPPMKVRKTQYTKKQMYAIFLIPQVSNQLYLFNLAKQLILHGIQKDVCPRSLMRFMNSVLGQD